MQVVRKVYSSMLETQMYAEEDDLGDLEETFQRIKMVTGLSDVEEIVHKFLSRSEKAQQLEQDAEDIRQRIDDLKKHNDAQRQILEVPPPAWCSVHQHQWPHGTCESPACVHLCVHPFPFF